MQVEQQQLFDLLYSTQDLTQTLKILVLELLRQTPTPFQGFASQKFVSYPNTGLSYDKQRPPAGDRERTPRGSFVIKRVSNAANYVAGLAVANNTIPAMGSTTVYVDVQIKEPLLMSHLDRKSVV